MPLFFPRGWRVALVKTDEAAQSTPSLGNDVLRSASAPGDTWLSEHIPLAAIHTPLILTYTLGETSTLFTGFTPSVLSPLCFSFCPLPASCDAVLHSSFFSLSSYAFVVFQSTSLSYLYTYSAKKAWAPTQHLSKHPVVRVTNYK